MKNIHHLSVWYVKNLGRIVILISTIVVLMLFLQYIPYVNIFINSYTRLVMVLLAWFILFSPKQKTLRYLFVVTLGLAGFLLSVGFSSLNDRLGDILYLLLVFLFICFIRGEKK